LVLVAVLSNFTYAQENLTQKTLYEITKHTTSKQNADIHVGEKPVAIGVATHMIYIANSGDNTALYLGHHFWIPFGIPL
jgi:hypothetical protein